MGSEMCIRDRWPFGRMVVDAKPMTGPFTVLGNIIWFIVVGLWIAIGHVLTAIPMFLSIVGIPLAIANLKMIPVSLVPLGKRIVDSGSAGSLPQYVPGGPQAGYRYPAAPYGR